MKNKNLGFTLIELLVVIVILAIVALITTPIVLDVIGKATDKANRSSVYGIMETARLYRIEKMFKEELVPEETNILSELKIKGVKPKNGDVRINRMGYIAIALKYGNKCYTKAYENEDISEIVDSAECKISGGGTPIIGFDTIKLVNKPKLTDGMTPIKWNGSDWVSTNESDPDWYNYSNKEWANAKTADGSFWVWIPRYAYKMNGEYHNGGTGISSSFDVKFLKGLTNEAIDTTTIETSGYDVNTKNTLNNYFLHPAFQNNMNEYGFWVAKFEPSGTASNIKIVPNVASLRSMAIGDQFNSALSMKDKVAYGWNTSKVDTHMMTNIEWGAVTYLTHSVYGKNAEVWINPSTAFITGCAGTDVSVTHSSGCNYAYNTTNGGQASTTGNTYGIYDMSGGAGEYVSAYVNNNDSILTPYGQAIINADIKYKNIYIATTDTDSNNYNDNKNIYGDAIWETSNSYTDANSWNNDYSYMPYSSYLFFLRGSNVAGMSYAGLFGFVSVNGDAHSNFSFRPIVSIK